MLTRREIVEYYGERTGLPIDNWRFYEVFGLFRLAVIAQQIYYRFHHGRPPTRRSSTSGSPSGTSTPAATN